MSNDHGARGTLTRGVDEVTVTVHEGIDSVSDAARPAVERMAFEAHAAVDRVAGVATQAAETLGIKGEQLKSAQQKLVESAREYMRERPVTALGVAVAVGYVLSRLLSPR